jgi:hypothetical protein
VLLRACHAQLSHVDEQVHQCALSLSGRLLQDSTPISLVCRTPAGAFVQGSSVLSWAANNSAKLGLAHPEPYQQLQCWTLISTDAYGQANKVGPT